jgi:hypothetical protein
LNFSK